jgi:hypothetical protein
MAAAAHYRQPWVLLSRPEFRMSPGNPNYHPSPYPTFVTYKHRAPPRSFEPANTELKGAPGMKSVSGYDYPVAFAKDDGLIDEGPDDGLIPLGFFNHSHGTSAPGAQVHTPPPPRIHGITGSSAGVTASGVPQRALAQTVVGGSTPSVNKRRRQDRDYDDLVREGQKLIKERRTRDRLPTTNQPGAGASRKRDRADDGVGPSNRKLPRNDEDPMDTF